MGSVAAGASPDVVRFIRRAAAVSTSYFVERGMPRARETRAHASVEMQDARLERSASAAFEISHDAASPFSAPSRARNVCTARE